MTQCNWWYPLHKKLLQIHIFLICQTGDKCHMVHCEIQVWWWVERPLHAAVSHLQDWTVDASCWNVLYLNVWNNNMYFAWSTFCMLIMLDLFLAKRTQYCIKVSTRTNQTDRNKPLPFSRFYIPKIHHPIFGSYLALYPNSPFSPNCCQ